MEHKYCCIELLYVKANSVCLFLKNTIRNLKRNHFYNSFMTYYRLQKSKVLIDTEDIKPKMLIIFHPNRSLYSSILIIFHDWLHFQNKNWCDFLKFLLFLILALQQRNGIYKKAQTVLRISAFRQNKQV